MAERMCGRCGEHPVRGKSQRWCQDCHAAYQRRYRESLITLRHERRLAGTLTAGPMCGIYFIHCDGFIKIGLASDVGDRFRQLKTANPHSITPLGFIPTQTYEVAERVEAELHHQFGLLRHRGEWFRQSRELIDFIAKNTNEWPVWAYDVFTWNAPDVRNATPATT